MGIWWSYICKWSNSASVRLKKGNPGWGPSCAKRGTSSLPHQGGSTAPELKNDELLPVDVRICKISRKTRDMNGATDIWSPRNIQTSSKAPKPTPFQIDAWNSADKLQTDPMRLHDKDQYSTCQPWLPWGFFWCWNSALQTDEWHPWEALSSNDINAQCIRTHLGNSIFYMHSFVSHVYSQAFAGRLVSHLES